MISQLGLQVIETGDPRTLRIVDNSVYSPGITVSCEQLHITPPGFTYPAAFEVDKGFNSLFTSENLGLTSANSAISDLPDGIYILRYSINPNEKMWVEYYHLRNTAQIKLYNELLCRLDLQPCDTVSKDLEANLKATYTAKMYMDAAKAMVEYCNAPKQGIALYEYATKLLEKIEKKLINKCKSC